VKPTRISTLVIIAVVCAAAGLPGRGAVAALLAGLDSDGVRRQPGMTLDAPDLDTP